MHCRCRPPCRRCAARTNIFFQASTPPSHATCTASSLPALCAGQGHPVGGAQQGAARALRHGQRNHDQGSQAAHGWVAACRLPPVAVAVLKGSPPVGNEMELFACGGSMAQRRGCWTGAVRRGCHMSSAWSSVGHLVLPRRSSSMGQMRSLRQSQPLLRHWQLSTSLTLRAPCRGGVPRHAADRDGH